MSFDIISFDNSTNPFKPVWVCLTFSVKNASHACNPTYTLKLDALTSHLIGYYNVLLHLDFLLNFKDTLIDFYACIKV